MVRRQFLASLAAAPLLTGKNRIGSSRISAITDEIGTTPDEAIAFARQYGLKWVELRGVPGVKTAYDRLPEADLKAAARSFRDNGLGVSFLNTGFLKTTLPGTEPVLKKPEDAAARERRIAKDQLHFDTRIENLNRAIRAAHILGVKQLRVFTFLRVAEPAGVEQRIANILGEMAHIAGREGMRILVENEVPCNVVTCREIASFMKLMPEKTSGVNWDPMNGTSRQEIQFPDGYNLLPKKRLGNVQMKGHTLLDPKHKLDWAGIFAALGNDGYRGQVGLETHYFDGTLIEKSHLSIREILRIVES